MPNVATIPEIFGMAARVTGPAAGLAAEIYLSDHILLDLSKATGSLESYRTIMTRSFVLLAGVRIKLRS